MEVSGSLEIMQNFQKELSLGREKDGKMEFQSFSDKITLENINFKYGNTPVLNNIQLEIKKNESVAFVGESGSGKITIFRILSKGKA